MVSTRQYLLTTNNGFELLPQELSILYLIVEENVVKGLPEVCKGGREDREDAA